MSSSSNLHHAIVVIIVKITLPNAIGLLHHLLTTSSSSSSGRHSLPPSYLIAIIERGDGGDDYFTSNKTTKPPSSSSSSPPPVNSSSSINQWFESSHSPTSLHNDIHLTLHQRNLHNRILELSCGRGFGGGSLINAGLVIPPEPWDDFELMRYDWPGVWRGRERIRMTCNHLMRFVTEKRREDDDGYYWDEFCV